MTEPLYHEVVLYEYFGEYLAVLHDPKYRHGYARSYVVADLFHGTEAGIKYDISQLPGYITDHVNTFTGDVDGGYIFTVHGELDDHKKLFDEMADELQEGPQGGDDDVYDYWPGAIDCLEDYARELYELSKDDHYKRRMLDINSRNLEVDEWEGVNWPDIPTETGA